MQAAPPYHESSIPAVRLLQGPVYSVDAKTWDLVIAHESKLGEYFAALGLRLVVAEADGFAYLRPFEEEETPDGYDAIPGLMRRSKLGFEATLLAVLLREELRKFDEHDLDSEACAVPEEELFAAFADFYGEQSDEKRLRAKFASARRTMEELKFVRVLEAEPPQILIRPIVKARLTPERLREIKSRLEAHLRRGRGDGVSVGHTGDGDGDGDEGRSPAHG
ncbi:hypothetical protein BH23VER1_BH23VER1_14720 [soil metagenome]